MRKIVITENVANEIRKDTEMSEYRFESNVKRFLAELLEDPVHAKPSATLILNGFDRVKLLKTLQDEGILERHEHISDRDKDGNYKKATMKVGYKVRKKGLDDAITRIYNDYFVEALNEEGGAGAGGGTAGAAAGSAAAGVVSSGAVVGNSGSGSSGATSCASCFGGNGEGYYVPPLELLKQPNSLKVNWLKPKKKKKRKN